VDLFAKLYKATGNRRFAGGNQPADLRPKGKVIALDAKFNFDPTRCSVTRKSSPTAIWTKKIQPKSKPPSSTWPTSRWTATSAAW
jgi:hypothetical protein